MTNRQLHNLKKKWLIEGYKIALNEMRKNDEATEIQIEGFITDTCMGVLHGVIDEDNMFDGLEYQVFNILVPYLKSFKKVGGALDDVYNRIKRAGLTSDSELRMELAKKFVSQVIEIARRYE